MRVAARHNAFVLPPIERGSGRSDLSLGGEAFRDASEVSVGHMMKTIKVTILLATGFFVLGFAVALRPLMQGGFWPELAVMFICLGALQLGPEPLLKSRRRQSEARTASSTRSVGFLSSPLGGSALV